MDIEPVAEHANRNRDHVQPDAERKGIGLYTYEQQKNTTPFQYFVHIVVGGVIAVISIGLLYATASARHEEIAKYGTAGTHVWDWVVSFSVITIGIFLGHAGIIFYFRRARARIHKTAKRMRFLKKHKSHPN